MAKPDSFPIPKTPSDTAPRAPEPGAGLTGTLMRGLAILDVLIPAGQPLTLAELASATGLDQSTTLRLLRTLEEAQRVLRVGDGKRYVASPKALRPLPLLHPVEQLRREADPILRQLSARTGNTVVLVAYIGGERLVVDVMMAANSLTPYYATWLHGPLHASGPGKASLLAMDDKQRRAALETEPYTRLTAHTLTTWDELATDLQRSQERGYVTVRDEFYDGLSAIAANFMTWTGRVLGCIAITGRTAEFDEDTVAAMAVELLNSTRLMPLQVTSLGGLEQLSGRY